MKSKDQTLLEEAYDKVVQPRLFSSIENVFNQIPSVLDNKGVKYEKEETDYASGAWKHSICYSFTINGEEFEIEEHEHTNGKRTLSANINSDPNDDSEYNTFSYITYNDYNMEDFLARLESALKDK